MIPLLCAYRGNLMAADLPGSTKNLSDSRAEGMCTRSVIIGFPDSNTALQALVTSLAPGESSSTKIPSKEVLKLSDKLKELLGDADGSQRAVQRNERGEVCICTGAK